MTCKLSGCGNLIMISGIFLMKNKNIIMVLSGLLLIEQATHSKASTDLTTAKRWIRKITDVQKELTELDPVESTNSSDIVFDGYVDAKSKL